MPPLARMAPAYRARRLSSGTQRKSPHLDWYSQILPSMLPIAVLASSLYLVRTLSLVSRSSVLNYHILQGLHLLQTNLARERHADQAKARIEALENELTILRHQNVSSTMTEDPQPRFRRWRFI